MEPDVARERFRDARVARLATVDEHGQPHVVPVCYALEATEEGDRVVSMVDGKPKSTTALRRLANLAYHPTASFLVDHYDEDWSTLWWVRVDGDARVVTSGPEHVAAAALLTAKYPQYRSVSLAGPAIVTAVQRWRSWSAEEGSASA